METSLKSSNTNCLFGLNFFKNLKNNSPDSNIIFSPMSIYLALALTASGAVGDTQQEIVSTLLKNSKNSSLENLIEDCKLILQSALQSNNEKNIFQIAN